MYFKFDKKNSSENKILNFVAPLNWHKLATKRNIN